MTKKVRAFLDTSALFSGIWSDSGGSRMILKLGEAEAIEIWLGPSVLKEASAVIRRKAVQALPGMAALLEACHIRIGPRANPAKRRRSCALTDHPGDAQVLAEAWTAGIDFFVTLDKEHFLGNRLLRSSVPFTLGTPGDFLTWFRGQLGLS